MFGHVNVIKLLLDRRADNEAEDKKRKTPVHPSSSAGQMSLKKEQMYVRNIGEIPLKLAMKSEGKLQICYDLLRTYN